VQDSQDFEVLATVHCEAEWNRNDQVGETQWLSDIHAQTGLPTAIVAHAWFDTDNAEEVLSKQAAFPLVKGIRSKPKTTLSPDLLTKNLPGGMQDNRWLEGYARLEQYGLSWDLRVPYWHLYEAAEVARQFPNTPIVLNHTGFPWDRSAQGIDAWSKAMEALAKHHHVHLKVSEFGLKDQAWDFASNKEIVLRAIGIFGIERCMFASNFPVAGLRVDFSTLLNSVASMVSEFSEKQQHDFFVGNAARFYRLDI
jgi:predicted TIM-barrel fold metal-dependent hydrolase